MTDSGDALLQPREVVILAEDYDALVAWYVGVLGFRVVRQFSEAYRYSNLETRSRIRVGIAPASEAGVAPSDRACNTVLLRVAIADVKAFFEHLHRLGTAAAFGPSFDEAGQFWYGGSRTPKATPSGWSTRTAREIWRRCMARATILLRYPPRWEWRHSTADLTASALNAPQERL